MRCHLILFIYTIVYYAILYYVKLSYSVHNVVSLVILIKYIIFRQSTEGHIINQSDSSAAG